MTVHSKSPIASRIPEEPLYHFLGRLWIEIHYLGFSFQPLNHYKLSNECDSSSLLLSLPRNGPAFDLPDAPVGCAEVPDISPRLPRPPRGPPRLGARVLAPRALSSVLGAGCDPPELPLHTRPREDDGPVVPRLEPAGPDSKEPLHVTDIVYTLVKAKISVVSYV